MAAATDNMKIATKVMKQTAVYWEPNGVDEFGKPEWTDPVEISCRWEDKQQEFINANGETQISSSVLFVDRDLELKGVLLLGELDSLVDEDDPKLNDGAWEILQTGKLPDFKGKKYLRTVYL